MGTVTQEFPTADLTDEQVRDLPPADVDGVVAGLVAGGEHEVAAAVRAARPG
jgi:hypothetical protein